MTNEEKIRLVLETLGTDNVKQANRVLREMQEELTKVGDASTKAAGKGGVNGQGVLQLAYFIDDLQYGMRGIMNNIPGLIQQLGLGAGLAGVAGIAAVAVGTLVEKHPEWFEWSKKVKETLKELTDAIKAEEEAIKRQKEQVDKLGESTSKRIEDVLKLKEATEQLKDAEAKLAEDRKNAKATEEADKNAGALATEELNRQKEVIKSVITDAGLQKQVRDELKKQIERSTPEITDAQAYSEGSSLAAAEAGPAAWNALSPEAKANLALQNMGKGRATLQNKRNDEIQKSVESIFGGLINPANMDELNRSMEGIGKFLPGVAGELRNVYQFDRDAEAFDAGNDRWRRGGGARRRAEERAIQQGEAAGARIGPNVAMFDENQRRDMFAEQAKEQARLTQDATIRNQVMGIADPGQMAAARMYQAAQAGPNRNRVLRNLERRDMELYAGAMSNAGMTPADAQQAAQESLAGGNRAFQDFAAATGKNLNSNLRTLEAATMFMQQQKSNMDEINMRLNMLYEQINAMGGQAQPTARPPARVRN